MNLAPATITVLDGSADTERGLPPEFRVQFNPTDLTFAKGANYAEIAIPGLDSPILQFVAGQNEKLTVELFFDTTDKGMGAGATDVRTKTTPFYQLVKMQPKTHAPPKVEFRWGEVSFTAVVESVQQKFTLFSPDGIPLRASLSVTFREYKSLDDQVRELNPQSADHTKTYRVNQGDTLGAIAAREYGDPAQWRRIAEENADRLPSLRRLPLGLELALPPAEFLAGPARGRS